MRRIQSENGLKKGPWSEEEDLKLIQYVQTHGPGQWRTLPKKAGLQRCGKSCRLRWTNYLRPDIKRGRFSFDEEVTIVQLHSLLGNKWSAIASSLPGRTDNEIKNYWNTHIRKRLLRNGIDPVTHTPHLDFLEFSSILNSPLFILSKLLNLQTLVNPQLLNLVNTILASSSSKNENQDLFLNNHINPMNPYQNHQNSNFTFAPSNLLNTRSNRRHLIQANDIQNNPENLVSMNGDTSHDFFMPASYLMNDCFTTAPNYNNDQSPAQTSEKSSFQSSYTENIIPSGQNLTYESGLSSPMSSPTQLNSSLSFINSSTEDPIEIYCSSMFKSDSNKSFVFNDSI